MGESRLIENSNQNRNPEASVRLQTYLGSWLENSKSFQIRRELAWNSQKTMADMEIPNKITRCVKIEIFKATGESVLLFYKCCPLLQRHHFDNDRETLKILRRRRLQKTPQMCSEYYMTRPYKEINTSLK
jgi:hypothetical protein